MHTDLSTTEVDGKRKWIFPQFVLGIWWKRRGFLAVALILWLLAAPWISVNGHQIVFFDIVKRQIHFFGLTLWVNELSAILLFLLFVFSSILLVTVVLGRVFCGWACPITVFMEFVFRPIERALEGEGARQREFLSKPISDRIEIAVIKYSIFLVISLILGNTFVAYLMGSHRILPMIVEGPAAHMGAFTFMCLSSGLIFFQYGWFREQVCLFICPYGRLQSVLLDKDSLIVAYDPKRGEPRGKLGSSKGDCVDCKLCVRVCPTGIDIRNGLQLECVHCTACMDACDSIMDKVNRPRGLIRYQSESEVEGQKKRIVRPRLLIYLTVVAFAFTSLVGFVIQRKDFRATLHRESRDLYILQNDLIANPYRLNIINLQEREINLRIEGLDKDQMTIEVPEGPIQLQPLQKKAIHILVKVNKEKFRGKNGLLDSALEISEEGKSEKTIIDIRLVGPIFE